MSNDPLDQLLNVDTDEQMRPGFDTRFHARLAEKKAALPSAVGRRWWLALVPVVAASAAAVGYIVFEPKPQPQPPIEAADIAVAVALDYEMLENYDVIADLDTLEAYEMLAMNEVNK